jgi:YspA, cpYpsA-related SLOG family
MKVVICGSRDFTDGEAMFRWLDKFHAQRPITLVIEGGQRKWDTAARKHIGGADFWANQWAKARGIECQTVEAEWNNLSLPGQQRWYSNGRKINLGAGPIRNKRMATEFGATACISFGGGRGTASMEFEAKLAGLELIDVTADMLREVTA